MIRQAKVVCAGCDCHWAWETLQPEQFELFARVSFDEEIEIERSCPDCKAAAKIEAGIGPQFARSLADERWGRKFKAWTGRPSQLGIKRTA